MVTWTYDTIRDNVTDRYGDVKRHVMTSHRPSSSSLSPSLNDVLHYVIPVVYISTFLLGVFGNTLTIYVLLRSRRVTNTATVFILNLAVADNLFVICLPLMTYTSIVNQWIFGDALCKVGSSTHVW